MVFQIGTTIYGIEESELCYAPQFGGDFAGMMTANILNSDKGVCHWGDQLDALLLEVGAVNIRLGQLSSRLAE